MTSLPKGPRRELEEGARRELVEEPLRLLPDGDRCRARLFDTMLASYLVRPAAHGHSVEELALERAGIKAMSTKDAAR